MILKGTEDKAFDNAQRSGLSLAERKWRHLCGDLLEKGQTEKAILTARLLENTKNWFKVLDEDVRMLNVGSFDRFAFPMIRAVYPNLIATDLVSVQPMQGPSSLIFYLDTRYAVTKGTAAAGETSLSPIDGHAPAVGYPSELVDAEVVGTGDGNDLTPTIANLGWLPVRPGSVSITTVVEVNGAVTITDNGNGGLVCGTAGILTGTNTINYTTGAIVLTFDTNPPANTEAITASYRYISEGNTQRPELDIILTSALVTADTYTLGTNWTIEAEADFRSVHGLEAQATLMSQVAEQLRYEIDRDIIADLNTLVNAAGATSFAWDYTPPVGVDYYRHQLTFVNKLVEAGNHLFRQTRGKANGNFLVVGTNLATVIEALPQFVSADYGDAEGVVYIGQLDRWKIYKDPYMAVADGIMGHKGNSWLKAGYAYCPYVPLWRTPVVTLTDFKRRVGLMTRYAKKVINANFYTKVSVDNFGVL